MDTFMQSPRGGGGGAPYGVPSPQGVPMPQGVAMQPPGAPPPVPQAPPAYGAPPAVPNRMAGGDFLAQGRVPPTPLPGLAQAGQAAGIGQNGFGVHPNVTHDQIADYLLPGFRNVESSGNYKAKNPNSSASGAYGYINGTWNNQGGYPRAMDAPPEVQDARMKQDLVSSLNRFGGDPFKAVANHYYPKYAGDPTKWEQPITDSYGKEIPGAGTVKDYISKVLPPERVDKYLAGASTQ